MSGTAGYIYGPGQSEKPLIPGHLAATPLGVALSSSDAEGVVAGTTNHSGAHPRIKLTIKNNEITAIDGGGQYGRLWKQYLEEVKDVQYPLLPTPGLGHFIECSIGTNPKVYRPHNIIQPLRARIFSEERRRTGLIHLGFGNLLRENGEWAHEHGHPFGHFHVHLYFATLTVTTVDGQQVKLIDKGHLTILDDPEIRKIAQKYGDPDELLSEDWIPAIPGINVPGDYERDYARDPVTWITAEHRKAYANVIDFRPYQ